MKASARVRFSLLGGFEVHDGEGRELVLPTRKTRALLAYLAVPLGEPHSREKLASLLWGDMPDAQARGNLRHALSRIRRVLGSEAGREVLADGPDVALDRERVEVDVTRFERLVADGRPEALAEAAEVYRGDLLDGLAIAELPFAEWLTFERERLRELAIQGMARLLTHQQKAGALESAVQTGHRLLKLDPLQEPVHRAVMRAYAALGRREAALRQYQQCVDGLRRELHADPEAETTQLYEEIQRSRARKSDSSGAPPPARREPLAELMSSPAAARADGLPPTNLPASTSDLIGRELALAEVSEMLGVHRLVTLIGAGGIGKTRLALEVARQRRPEYEDGVWVAELASLSDPGLVPATVAVALGLRFPAGAGSPEQVAAALGSRRVLLVLDNCEHVIEAAARMAEALLHADPRACVMATSREPLRAAGEYVYRVPSLRVPAEDGDEAVDPLDAAAVRLFVARAQALDAHLSLDTRSAALMGAVCRRLDGIPLAIELAAVRTAALGIDGLQSRLDARFELLTGGHRTALPRHQTLRATLDWSHDLLSDAERVVLRRVAVFAGAFTLDAAAAIVAGGDVSPDDAVESIATLVAKSLIAADVGSAVASYRLLDTTRAYARDKLQQSGEAERFARRHAEYHRLLSERGQAAWETQPTARWLATYGRHVDDLRAALDWAVAPGGDAKLAVALTIAAVPLWFQLSLLHECRTRVDRALVALASTTVHDARLEMQLYAALGWSLMYTTGPARETGAAWATTLELAEELADTDFQLRALWGLWAGHMNNGEFRGALELAERFGALAKRASDPADPLIGHRMLAAALHFLGEQTRARAHIERMLGRYVSPVNRSDVVRFQFDQRVTARITLSRVLWLQGFADQAMRTVDGAIDDALAIQHTLSLCNALAQAACPLALAVGSLEAADRFATMLVQHTARHGADVWRTYGRCFKGMLLMRRDGLEVGLPLLSAAVEELRSARFVQYYTAFLAALAEGLAGAGQATRGLAVVDEALAQSERSEERWILPELLRLKGELVLRRAGPSGAGAAEEYFQRSLEWARRQGALAWELRGAASLADLWHRQGRGEPARELLDSVYRRFSEGFESADLRAARALLDRLT